MLLKKAHRGVCNILCNTAVAVKPALAFQGVQLVVPDMDTYRFTAQPLLAHTAAYAVAQDAENNLDVVECFQVARGGHRVANRFRRRHFAVAGDGGGVQPVCEGIKPVAPFSEIAAKQLLFAARDVSNCVNAHCGDLLFCSGANV